MKFENNSDRRLLKQCRGKAKYLFCHDHLTHQISNLQFPSSATMKSIQLLFSAALFASISMATPIANESPEALLPRELEERQTASGCNY